MKIQTLRTNSFSMDFVRFGNGPRPFAILPGLAVRSVLASADAVAAAYRAFAEDFTVWLFDPRKELPPAYDVRGMARDAAEAFRALGLADACVFGASHGGMVAMSMAVESPGLVRKLVLASTVARMTPERFRPLENWIALARAGKALELHLAFGEAVYPPDAFSGIRDAFAKTAETVSAAELARFAALAETMRGFDVADGLPKISCPTLVAGSRDDRLFGGAPSAQIAAAVPGAELLLYDDRGHAVYDTAPDFPARMLEFCRRP